MQLIASGPLSHTRLIVR